MKKTTRTYKKLHKWPGLILAFILIYYALSGIIMNHRKLVSGMDIGRNWLPGNYAYQNWNNAALKGNLILSPDSVLVYGNIGVWSTDTAFSDYTGMNQGFLEGCDNRKVFDLHLTSGGHLYAATQNGIYAYDARDMRWKKFELPVGINRFVGIESKGDTVIAINRSYLFKGVSEGIYTRFSKVELEEPKGYKKEVSLFKTIWQIHSGEILGIPGKVYVDVLGVITIILSVTGIIYFFFPRWIKRRKRRKKPSLQIITINKGSLKWHNSIGSWIFVLLILLFFTGMFLRPPLLIAIARAHIPPIPYTSLDHSNPWHDKLRDIIYDDAGQQYLLSTSDGMYAFQHLNQKPEKMKVQPPVSVMGITVFKPYIRGSYLIGSFNGLFLWHPDSRNVLNFAEGTVYKGNPSGKPVGRYKITGLIQGNSGKQYMVDYDKGVLPLFHRKNFPEMPENIRKKARMSLWNLALEIHTGRIFENILGDFYVLLVPLTGLASIMVVLSGYLLWKGRARKKAGKSQQPDL